MNRAFDWSPDYQERFSRICAERWGFRYSADDDFTLRDVVERAFQASDASDLETFADLIDGLPDPNPEVQAFIGLMTVGETSFFRDPAQFEALEKLVLPDIVARAGSIRKLRIWSAGCASGEEPYSIAMAIAEVVPHWDDWDIQIIATDLNRFALRRAQNGVYSEWSFRGMRPEFAEKYFVTEGKLKRLSHPCRRLVRFVTHNLVTEPVPNPGLGLTELDAIFCRNVTIYFDRSTTHELVARLYSSLKPDGWLFVGHAEPDSTVYRRFDPVDYPETVLYRRPRIDRSEAELPPDPIPSSSLSGPDPQAEPAGGPYDENPESSASLAADAIVAYTNKDFAAAYELLVTASKLNNDNPLPMHMLAQIAADEKSYDEALYWSYSALQRDAFHLPTLLLMGLVLLELGTPDRASTVLQQALFVDPLSPETHLYLSFVFKALNEPEREAKSRERALRLAQEVVAPRDDLLPVQKAGRAAADLLARS